MNPAEPSGKALNAVRLAHLIVSSRLGEGGIAMDATAGNGYDTVFLARLVGSSGRVYAVDIQPVAIKSTRARLEIETLSDRVRLRTGGHENLRALLPEVPDGCAEVVMFNLGYLPGSDKTFITRTETTLSALEEALRLLADSGVLTVVCYPGHAGGSSEAGRVCEWANGLPSDRFAVTICRTANGPEHSPFLTVVEKR